ncbi:MFS general substrate transporter [Lecanosticta acicola]|uniref:MFS general substrate transporter n=1 Tax=Lecanosticta acicola TaxID=111012 RepID=A0AAI8Z8K7_9PEZI|nr:MFS general substrate transporter [Lecanosticta acicola]
MRDLIRDSFFGRLLRVATRGQYPKYPEDFASFELPEMYQQPTPRTTSLTAPRNAASEDAASGERARDLDDSETGARDDKKPGLPAIHHLATPLRAGSEVSDKDGHVEKKRLSNADRTPSGFTVVTWYSHADSDNPRNWSNGKKLWTGLIVLLYTLAMYIASSMYTASIPHMMEMWSLGRVAASLGLSIYVFGYGLGPLIMSPLSEIPWIGRNPPYLIGFFFFVVLCVPIALVDNYAGMLVLRFLLGVAGSPALATGGASYGDFCTGMQLPYAIAIWAGGASAGPSIGPLVSNFAVQAKDWRWPFWETLWLAGPIFLVMFFTFPETSSDRILLARAQRLRKLTGRTDLMAESEIHAQNHNSRQELYFALIKPWEINLKDPAVLFTTVYLGLVYGIYYSFFESFPMVFGQVYHFSFGVLGIAFLCIVVGCILAVAVWCAFFFVVADKQMEKMKLENVPPEARLAPGLVATLAIPVGLFIFAWTSRASIHWSVPMLGVTLSMLGNFIIAQCVLIYLPFVYPRYISSLFAANGFARALLAAAAILFAIPMFEHLGVAWGVSLLAFLCCGCSVGIYVLFFFGANLRKRSKFAES